jgi:hypothetical protein
VERTAWIAREMMRRREEEMGSESDGEKCGVKKRARIFKLGRL